MSEKKFRLKMLTTPEYRHLWLLMYWVIYLAAFQALEHRVLPDSQYHYIHCKFDDIIPFCEYFVVPYLYWFVYMIGMSAYCVFYDKECFIYYMKLIMITSTIACIAYYVYPTALNLRPHEFVRNNVFTKIVSMIYGFDTSTNVCPSMHVTGTLSTLLASFRARRMKSLRIKLFMIISAIAICVSTVYMKQHSLIDVVWGVAVTGFAYAAVRTADVIAVLGKRPVQN